MGFEASRDEFDKTLERVREIHSATPLIFSQYLSEKFGVPIYLKIENQAPIGSYKWRGAGNMMSLLDENARKVGVICSSAGNHAQGVALSSQKLQIPSTIVMPRTAPITKVQKTQKFGGKFTQVILHGDSYDEAFVHAQQLQNQDGKTFIHPFDHVDVVMGQGTIALEIVEQMQGQKVEVGMILAANGGGGLIAGLYSAIQALQKDIEIVGVEPENAASMSAALTAGKPVKIDMSNTIADGAKVGQVGEIGYEVVRDHQVRILTSPEGRLCHTIIQMHQQEYMVLEGAGALGVDGLNGLTSHDLEKVKNDQTAIVVVLGGGNIDMGAYHGIVEKSLRYIGHRRDYIITFPQRPGALGEFTALLAPLGINISRFHYDEKAASIDAPVHITVDAQDIKNFSLLETQTQKLGFRLENVTNNYSNNP